MFEKGEIVTLAAAGLRPQYLNGAKVKVTGFRSRHRGTNCETIYGGEIVEMLTPRSGGRFRVGRQIEFPSSVIERMAA